MSQIDVNTLFGRAETAFQAGRYDAARKDLGVVLRVMGDHPQVLHLLALCEMRLGHASAALSAFRKALIAAPNDPQISSNLANLLDQQGDSVGALQYLDRVLQRFPNAVDARFNRALLRQRVGDLPEALRDLDELLVTHRDDPRLWEARGAINRQLGDFQGAAADYDRALELDPGRTIALHGAARIALERGQASALPAYRRAIAVAGDDPTLLLGLVEAMELEGGGGIELLAARVASQPDWIEGHANLARMRAEAGSDIDFTQSFVEAIDQLPADRALKMAYWRCLALAGRHQDALTALDGAHPGVVTDPELLLMEAVFASEAGLLDRADSAFAKLGAEADVDLARGRHALRKGDPALAVALLEPLALGNPGLVTAWAHLSLGWRLTGDPRHDWLCGQPGLYGTSDVELEGHELDALADQLRDLHLTRAHPIGQSLRGGTQTRGRLLARDEPIIGLLRERLAKAVSRHLSALPPIDAAHPLLRFRDRNFAFAGSWSVRLCDRGYHVHHVHPEGVLSSACYIALPDSVGQEQQGWLEIGAAPAELSLGLSPIAVIEPRPGRLALFPSYLFHGTRPFPSGERLTVAFDVVV